MKDPGRNHTCVPKRDFQFSTQTIYVISDTRMHIQMIMTSTKGPLPCRRSINLLTNVVKLSSVKPLGSSGDGLPEVLANDSIERPYLHSYTVCSKIGYRQVFCLRLYGLDYPGNSDYSCTSKGFKLRTWNRFLVYRKELPTPFSLICSVLP